MQMQRHPVHETAMICTVFIEDGPPHNQHFSRRNVAGATNKAGRERSGSGSGHVNGNFSGSTMSEASKLDTTPTY